MYNPGISQDSKDTQMAVELSEDSRRQLKAGLLEGLKNAINGDPGNTISGQPVADFLAGPPPSDPLGAFQHRGGRATCDRWARGDRSGILPNRDVYLRKLCTPYLGSNLPGDPTTQPPFEGGQCAASIYTITWERRVDVGGGNFSWTPSGPSAPITGPIEIVAGPDNGGPGCGPGLKLNQWQVQSQGGGNATNLGGGCVDVSPSYRNVQVQVLSGPDNCGDQPPNFDSGDPNPSPDPNPGPVGGPTGYPFPDIDITIGPGGEINVDFGDGEPPEVIEPAPDGEDDAGPASGSDPNVAPTNPGSAGGSGETGDGGEEDGEAPDGSELTGVLVRIVSAHENANRVDRSAVDVFRGVGYVAMGYPGLLGVDTSAAVVESPQFFHAQQRGLTAWRVRANVGFNLETTPYYREIEP